MLRPITAGVDGTRQSLAAADWGARESLRREVPLRLVHAWYRQPDQPAPPVAGQGRRRWAQRVLEEAESTVRGRHPRLEVIVDQVAESPATALVQAAAQGELLALGSRGLGGLTGFLTGSVSLATVVRAVRPVVLVRPDGGEAGDHVPDADGDRSTRTPSREVVLGLDPRRPQDEPLEFAFTAAACRSAPLRIVHTWTFPATAEAGTTDREGAERREEEKRFFSAATRPWRTRFPDVPVTEDLLVGHAGEHLVRSATGAGLVVVGRRTRHPVDGPQMGPVAHAVLHHVACPVAVVPSG
ncbi:universal stress protein [Streptomyces sp. TP-A0874]|uniref:universal stress protein n=1 Tax=Streptomyces sp. TP-A0874 TaxID=549819 RepID=UPI000852A9CB|nr:universal stress protein [Streptomyces sp. TP-A0874]